MPVGLKVTASRTRVTLLYKHKFNEIIQIKVMQRCSQHGFTYQKIMALYLFHRTFLTGRIKIEPLSVNLVSFDCSTHYM